jgi:hypothetical protein
MRFPELGIYLLPGHTDRPADLLDEVRAAEALEAWERIRPAERFAGQSGRPA